MAYGIGVILGKAKWKEASKGGCPIPPSKIINTKENNIVFWGQGRGDGRN